MEDDSSMEEIREKTTIGGAHFGIEENKKRIVLGKDCMLSENIYLTTTDSHSILNYNHQRYNHAADICIGNHVWIGRNCTVLKNTTISDNSVIGTSSVLLGFVKKNSIYAGASARMVKEDITWLREKI